MGAVYVYQIRTVMRDKALMVWVLAFPILLSLIFMAMFSGIEDGIAPSPIPVGIVEDAAYSQAQGLEQMVSAISDDAAPSSHLIDPTVHTDVTEAEAAAHEGLTDGYIVVVDGEPTLRLTTRGNATATSEVLRAVLDSYVQTGAQHQAITAALAPTGADPQAVARIGQEHTYTREVSVTTVPGTLDTPYYFSLLALACAMGMNVSMLAVQAITATSSHLGARRTLAALPRWQVLTAVLAASWTVIVVCLLVGTAFIRFVVGIDFGLYEPWVVLAIAVASLMACGAGAALGTTRMSGGIVAGIATLLSLFTGLYGEGSRQLADAVEKAVPLLAHANPLWQTTHAFHSLLYYDTLRPFARTCATMLALCGLFLAIALVRMRRMSHEHL